MPIPKSILQDIIKLRHMSGEEIREYFKRDPTFIIAIREIDIMAELQKNGLLIKRSGTV
jgi:hypothetical protein